MLVLMLLMMIVRQCSVASAELPGLPRMPRVLLCCATRKLPTAHANEVKAAVSATIRIFTIFIFTFFLSIPPQQTTLLPSSIGDLLLPFQPAAWQAQVCAPSSASCVSQAYVTSKSASSAA